MYFRFILCERFSSCTSYLFDFRSVPGNIVLYVLCVSLFLFFKVLTIRLLKTANESVTTITYTITVRIYLGATVQLQNAHLILLQQSKSPFVVNCSGTIRLLVTVRLNVHSGIGGHTVYSKRFIVFILTKFVNGVCFTCINNNTCLQLVLLFGKHKFSE